MSARRATALAGVLAMVCATGCIQVVYESVNLEEPITPARWKPLRPGAEMQECLDVLGAPFRVQTVTKGQIELIYRWQSQSEWGLRVSYSFERGLGISYEFRNSWRDIPALRLRFDKDYRLLDLDKGRLGDFFGGDPRRQELTRFGKAQQVIR